MANLDSLIESTGDSNFFNCINSPASGVVIYNTDGYENFNEDGLSKVSFDKSKYHRTKLSNIWINVFEMKYLYNRLYELAIQGKTIYKSPKIDTGNNNILDCVK